MERKITIEEHELYKEDYQMKMLKANSLEGLLKVAGRGINGSSYYGRSGSYQERIFKKEKNRS